MMPKILQKSKRKVYINEIVDYEVIDGDSLKATIDLGYGCYKSVTVRLDRLDTPELKSHDEQEKIAAKMARQHLIFLLTNQKIKLDTTRDEIKKICSEINSIVNIKCFDFDKYGRLLIEIWNNGININEQMISNGFAGKYNGGTKNDWKSFFTHSLC